MINSKAVAESEPSHTAAGKAKQWDPFGEQLHTKLPFDLAIFLPGIHLRRMKIHVHPKMNVQIFIAALVTVSKTQKGTT